MRIDRPWLVAEIDIDWRRLRGIVVCRLFGHAAPNELGDCERCRADLLHLSRDEWMVIAHRALNRHMRAHIEVMLESPSFRRAAD